MNVPVATVEPRHVLHFLNRGGFGPAPGQLKQVLSSGLSAYIAEQLDATADAQIEERIRRRFGDQDYSVAEMAEIYRGTSRFAKKELPLNGVMRMLENFYNAKLMRATRSRSQLYEVLVDFWFNHFNVSRVSARQDTIAYEREAIRPNVTRRFRDLLGATASHPAMLFYLDNYLSRKDSIVDGKLARGLNENYGRELLELHTVGVTAGYTQRDVIDAARAFTGWTLDHPRGDMGRGSGMFVFRPEEHDVGAKRVFDLELPAGGGREEGEKLLDFLSVHPATAKFISAKLVRRFVADDPPVGLVNSCAQTFEATRGDLRKVMLTLLESLEFWAKPGQPRFKTPFEYVVSALRAVDATNLSATPGITDSLEAMGMRPYYCTPPTGYSDRGVDWLSPAYLHRINFGFLLAADGITGVRVPLAELLQKLGAKAEDPGSIATAFNREIFGGGLSSTTLEAASAPVLGAGLVDRLFGMFTSKHGLASDNQPGSLASRVVGLLLASPEMQMR